MMEQKFDQPTQVFELLLSPTFKLYLGNLINFSCVKAKTESVERRQSIVMIKIFMFRFLRYDGTKNWHPQPRFLSSRFHLLSN